ncbi:hypothetical protein H0H93_001610 [Arthromyces matolae]|nr:hypothetical protein H0H93_001610 [Arthromyces matolae]
MDFELISLSGRHDVGLQVVGQPARDLARHFVQRSAMGTTVNDVKVENKIGDAIVRRIVRAHRDKTPWKCCIVIPLLPGFTFPVDHSDASAIRIILECQNRTISRGPHSIFGRLRKEGIDPDEYISIFSLRNWAKMRGDVLTTEQVYIHGKICIVDDRLAIIGSANINERSQRGDRDSELAAVIRDTDMIDCTMGGKPFKVGRFAHTLRVRLMREHLGVDVEALDEDLMERQPVQPSFTENIWDPDAEQSFGVHEGVTHVKKRKPIGTLFRDTVANQVFHATEKNNSNNTTKAFDMGIDKTAHPDDQVLSAEKKTFTRDGQEMPGFASTDVPTLEEKTLAEHRPPLAQINISQSDAPLCTPDDDQEASSKSRIPQTDAQVDDNNMLRTPDRTDESPQTSKNGYPPPHPRTINNEEMTTVEPRTSIRRSVKTWNLTTPRPKVESNGFDDPISDAFWKNVWVASAAHNTEIYRKVFHAIPDDLVTTWKQYKEFVLHHERLNKRLNESVTPDSKVPSDEGLAAEEKSGSLEDVSTNEGQPSQKDGVNGVASTPDKESRHRRPAKGSEPFEKWERDEMERLLGQLNGHLVVFPTRFLQGEDIANNFLFNADRLMPLPIYD